MLLSVLLSTTRAQPARLEAYADVLAPRKPADRTLSAALKPPALDWDDASTPPDTIHTTAYYRTGEASRPGVFAVARKGGWLRPSAHSSGPAPSHHADSPTVDPAAATMHPWQQQHSGSREEWESRGSVDAVRLRLRGLPPQVELDWPMAPRPRGVAPAPTPDSNREPGRREVERAAPGPPAEGEAEAAAAAVPEVILPSASEAPEWGASSEDARRDSPAASDGGQSVTTPVSAGSDRRVSHAVTGATWQPQESLAAAAAAAAPPTREVNNSARASSEEEQEWERSAPRRHRV